MSFRTLGLGIQKNAFVTFEADILVC